MEAILNIASVATAGWLVGGWRGAVAGILILTVYAREAGVILRRLK